MEITPDTVEVVPLIQRGLANIDNNINPKKTVALPRNGARSYAGGNSLLKGVDVLIAERGRVKVVGVSIGTDAYAMDCAMGIFKNSGAEHLATMLPLMPDKQSANLIATVANSVH